MNTNFYGARNNVSAKIPTGGSYTAGAGSITVDDASGFLYTDGSTPSATKPIVVSTFLANGTPKGVYRCEAKSGNTLTLTALLSGTDGSLAVGDIVEMRHCAEHVGQVAGAVNANETAVAALQADDATTVHSAAASTPTKGTVLVGNGTAWVAFGVGANGQVVTADSTQTLGVKWAAGGGGGLAIGGAVSSGTAGRVLFEASGPVLADSDRFKWTDVTSTATLGVAAAATTITTPGTSLVLEQTGNASSVSRLTLGAYGGTIENPGAVYIVDLHFKTPGGDGFFRVDWRGTGYLQDHATGVYPELEYFPAGSPSFVTGQFATGVLFGDFVVGSGALATTATAGFPYFPGGAGPPTGTPLGYAGRYPLYYDSTNNKLWIYSGSSWRGVVLS